MDIDYLLLTLKTDREVNLGVSPLSLQISTHFQKLMSKHGHSLSGGNYPLIQYKVIRGAPLIVAVNEGCDILWEVYDSIDEINERSLWKVTERRLIDKKVKLGPSERKIRYRFLTPWLTIPADEIDKNTGGDAQKKNKTLAAILENNFLGIARNFNIEVENDLSISLNERENFIVQKDTGVAGFFGTFYIDFELPSFLGLGRSVSRGFGTIKQS